jgi:hypothetical protein
MRVVVKCNPVAEPESFLGSWYFAEFRYDIMDMVFHGKTLVAL